MFHQHMLESYNQMPGASRQLGHIGELHALPVAEQKALIEHFNRTSSLGQHAAADFAQRWKEVPGQYSTLGKALSMPSRAVQGAQGFLGKLRGRAGQAALSGGGGLLAAGGLARYLGRRREPEQPWA